MKLFGFLNSRSAKAVEENEMLPQIEAIEGTNDEDTSSIEEGKREASNIVTITYGTGYANRCNLQFCSKRLRKRRL